MPDNFVQDPYNTQNYNRYSYVLNNPLLYVDYSGEMAEGVGETLLWLGAVIISSAATSWNWISKQAGDAGKWIGKQATSAWNWIGKQSKSVGDAIARPFRETGRWIRNLFGGGGGGSAPIETPIWMNVPMSLGSPSSALTPIFGTSGGEVNTNFINSISNSQEFSGIQDWTLYNIKIPEQDFSGFWGGANYYWTGGIMDGYRYHRDGTVAGLAPSMGIVPTPTIGSLGTYAQMAKLTKGFKGAFQAHHLTEARHLKALALSTKNAPSVILSRADHAAMTSGLQRLLPYGQTYTKTQIISAYKQAYKDYPEWLALATKYLK
jgi:hypothetical protein